MQAEAIECAENESGSLCSITGPSRHFEELFQSAITKAEVIVTFLALLGLMKLNQVIVRQSDLLGDIVIERCDNSAVAALEAAEVGADYQDAKAKTSQAAKTLHFLHFDFRCRAFDVRCSKPVYPGAFIDFSFIPTSACSKTPHARNSISVVTGLPTSPSEKSPHLRQSRIFLSIN